MNSVRAALLELCNLQKQKLTQQEVELRHLRTQLNKWESGSSLLTQTDIGDTFWLFNEHWRIESRDRTQEILQIKRLNT